MQKKRRDREEIMFEILNAAIEPATRTRLIYASFLSNTELRQYISLLLENKMLEVDTVTKAKFKITEEGRKFLDLYADMNRMMTNSASPHITNIGIQRPNMIPQPSV